MLSCAVDCGSCVAMPGFGDCRRSHLLRRYSASGWGAPCGVQVIHARLKGAAPRDFAIKIMDKHFIKKEEKVRRGWGGGGGLRGFGSCVCVIRSSVSSPAPGIAHGATWGLLGALFEWVPMAAPRAPLPVVPSFARSCRPVSPRPLCVMDLGPSAACARVHGGMRGHACECMPGVCARVGACGGYAYEYHTAPPSLTPFTPVTLAVLSVFLLLLSSVLLLRQRCWLWR
jgi:hypothetical protein